MRYATEMRAIENDEMRDAIAVSSYPHMKESGQRKIMHSLKDSKPPSHKIAPDMRETAKKIQAALDKRGK